MIYQQQPEREPTPIIEHHQETFMSAVGIPVIQSAAIGLAVALFGSSVAWAAGAAWELIWKIFLIGFTGVLAFLLIVNTRAWSMRLERLLNIDLNGDNKIGNDPVEIVKAIVVTDTGNREDHLWLKGGQDALRTMATALLYNKNEKFSERQWAGPGKVFPNVEHHRENVRQLLERGMIETRSANGDPNNGYRLLEKGRPLMMELIGENQQATQSSRTPSPLPSQVTARAYETGYVGHARARTRENNPFFDNWRDQDLK